MDASWFEPVRAYCERTDAAFWGEPANALSNAAFLVAAAGAAVRTSRTDAGRGDRAARALALLIAVVGVGSFLFHTHANRWSMLADVAPIGVFILAYFGLAMHRFFALPVPAAILATVAFAGFHFGFTPAIEGLTGASASTLANGSLDYAPAALALFGVGGGLVLGSGPADRRTGGTILLVGLVFLASLGLRTVDAALCAHLPLGTHFLWHVLNACVLYGLVAAAVDHRRRNAGRTGAVSGQAA